MDGAQARERGAVRGMTTTGEGHPKSEARTTYLSPQAENGRTAEDVCGLKNTTKNNRQKRSTPKSYIVS